ncbi:hypothetical protein PIB30_111443, partial [Stylosanthes scabra]|nr:hypothetical protein [Stylosanthes scabra]
FRGQCCFSGLPFQELPQSCFQLVDGVVPLIDPFLRGRQRVAFGRSLVGWYFFHRRFRVTGACDSYSFGSSVPTDGANVKDGPLTIVQEDFEWEGVEVRNKKMCLW